MLQSLSQETPAQFVDWFEVDRDDGRDRDVGFQRHWLDPTEPSPRPCSGRARHAGHLGHADRRQRTTRPRRAGETAWRDEARSGAAHLGSGHRAACPRPSTIRARPRLRRHRSRPRRPGALAAAYRELFLAAGGGALGLFTAIARLRAVQR
jgi:ATP-dependent DNA helicase DinG